MGTIGLAVGAQSVIALFIMRILCQGVHGNIVFNVYMSIQKPKHHAYDGTQNVLINWYLIEQAHNIY